MGTVLSNGYVPFQPPKGDGSNIFPRSFSANSVISSLSMPTTKPLTLVPRSLVFAPLDASKSLTSLA